MIKHDVSDQPEYVAEMRSPWTFAPQIGDKEACFTGRVFNVDGNCIATMEATSDDSVATANARLMAAAPELLKACETLLMLSLPQDVSGMAMVEVARRAVRKAKGLD